MGWVLVAGLVLAPAARYVDGSDEARAWWVGVARLSAGVALALMAATAPYMALYAVAAQAPTSASKRPAASDQAAESRGS